MNYRRLSMLFFTVLVVARCGFAGEAVEEKFLSPVHLGLRGEQMTLTWVGTAPNLGRVRDFDVKIFACNPDKKALSIQARERAAPKHDVTLIANKDGAVGIAITDSDKTIDFSQTSSDVVLSFLAANKGEWKAASFKEFLHHHAEQAQVLLLHPLTDLGVTIEPAPDFPAAMALATSGFSEGDPKAAAKADELIRKLSDGDEARKEAGGELIKLFPFAIQHITQAAEKADNEGAKKALQNVIAAHPTIKAWRSYVESNKLHEDRKYLLEILRDVPLFKAAARARLTALHGKDFGDDAAAWPK